MGVRGIKRVTQAMLIGSLVLSSVAVGHANKFTGFDDVQPSNWYYEPVKYMVERGAVNGYGNERFLPENNITRVEFASILFNSVMPKGKLAEQVKKEAKDKDGRDLAAELEKRNPTYWGNDMIAISRYYGLIGFDDTLAEWSQTITRAEMAELVVNTAEKVMKKELKVDAAIDKKIADYDIVRLIPEYEYIAKAYTAGVLNGDHKGYYKPMDNATRAEACVIVKNLLTKV